MTRGWTKAEAVEAVAALVKAGLEAFPQTAADAQVAGWRSKEYPDADDVEVLPGHVVRVGRFEFRAVIPRRAS